LRFQNFRDPFTKSGNHGPARTPLRKTLIQVVVLACSYLFIGLYLGGSLISIGHIPVYIIFSLLERPRKRRVVAEDRVPVEFALRTVSVMDKNALAHELVTG